MRAVLVLRHAAVPDLQHVGVVPRPGARRQRVLSIEIEQGDHARPAVADVAGGTPQVAGAGAPLPRPVRAPLADTEHDGATRFGERVTELGVLCRPVEPLGIAPILLNVVDAPLGEGPGIDLLGAVRAGAALAGLTPGVGVEAELEPLGMDVLRQRLHATREADRIGHEPARRAAGDLPAVVDQQIPTARGGRAGRAQGRPSVARKEQAQQTEEPADRQPHVERHQKNTAFKITVTASTTTASVTGRWNQLTAVSTGWGVRPYTRPRSCSGARGRVTRDTRMVTTKHVVQATIAVQNVCASSLGKVVMTPR